MMNETSFVCPGVVPVLVGPLQVILTVLPGILLATLRRARAHVQPQWLPGTPSDWPGGEKVAVTILALVVGGGIFGYRTFMAPLDACRLYGQLGSCQSGRAGWQRLDHVSLRSAPQRRAGVPGNTASPTVPRSIWSFKDGDEGFLASPAIVGNRVYIASALLGAFEKTGKIYCFDADTGAVIWSSALPATGPRSRPQPVVQGNYLVCGEGLHDTRDARVVCLDIRPSKKGEVVWTFETRNHVECTPVIANGKVYFGAGDDGIYCLDLQPRGPGWAGSGRSGICRPTKNILMPRRRWRFTRARCMSVLAMTAKANVCVLDAETGKELKRLPMPYPVFGPPTIADGRLIFGMGEGDYVKPGKGGEVRCLNLKTLEHEWSFSLEKTVLGAVAAKGDRLFFGCQDGFL